MEEAKLIELGLTKGEVKIYLALVKFGSLSKINLSVKSSVSSSKVYEVANKLIIKGLVGSTIKNNTKYFFATNPSFLKELLKRKQEKIKEEEELIKELIPLLKKKYEKNLNQPQVEFFEGWKGISNSLLETLEKTPKNSTIYGIGIEMKKEGILHKYHRKRIERNIKQKLILSEKPSYRSEYKNNEIRILKEIFDCGIGIFPKEIILQDQSEEPIFIIIRNEKIRNSLKKIYDVLWKKARTL
ncbi:MAG: hypothetical protein KJ949_00235 [Nanoarchaeota archaeon]|nr:hypothetical protein [Nanoarchaeota archaeon]